MRIKHFPFAWEVFIFENRKNGSEKELTITLGFVIISFVNCLSWLAQLVVRYIRDTATGLEAVIFENR